MVNSNGGPAADTAPDLGPGALVYIEKVRKATQRLRARETDPDNVQEAIEALRDVSTFDVEVPTASQRRELEFVKAAIKKLTIWYMRFLAAQLNVFGAHVVRLGSALSQRTDALESASDELAVRLRAAEERIRRLETQTATRSTRAKRGPTKDAAVED